jgi:Beta-lactamase enzyme family
MSPSGPRTWPRLTVRLGGTERAGAAVVQRRLHRMGATSSTFTGFYRLGTAAIRPLGDTPRPLPLLTHRRTTARDVGRILLELHAAALGSRLSARRTGLSRHEASVALGLLLTSDTGGGNLGLFRPALGPDLPMAQKHGWTSSVRHSAAVVYGRRGPKIVVLLTYRRAIQDRPPVLLGLRLVRAARIT